MILCRVDDTLLLKDDAAIVARSKQLASVFRRLREPLREDQRDHAEKQRGPDGKWPPRAPATRERKRIFRQTKRKKGAIEATYFQANGVLGALPDMLQVRATGFAVFARSPLKKIAPVHQFGAVVGRGSVIPERPFVYVSEAMAARAAKMIGDFVLPRDKRGRFQKRA